MEGVISINRFIKFDAVQFLKESRTWDEEIAQLKHEADESIGIKGQSDSCGRSGKIGDPTLADAMTLDRIQDEISRYEYYKHVLRSTMDMLPREYREVLEAFFFKGGYKSRLVREYGLKYGLSTKLVYTARREALNEFARIVEECFL